MLVVEALTSEGILGLDFLEGNVRTINTASRCLQFAKKNVSLPLYRPLVSAPLHLINVHLTQTVQLSARSTMATPEELVIGGD